MKFSLNIKNIVMWTLFLFYSIIIIMYYGTHLLEGATNMDSTDESESADKKPVPSTNDQSMTVKINGLQKQLNDIQNQINLLNKPAKSKSDTSN